MKVVIDTNVFVSSFFGGLPRQVIDHWRKWGALLCLSGPILNEYVEVCARLGLDGEPEYDELVGLLASDAGVVFAADPPAVAVVSDPDDDKFVACAVALRADWIISGDKALLALGRFGSTRIGTPRQFLESAADAGSA